MYISVDSISEGIAKCEKEDMTTFELPLSSLPEGVKEGSVLFLDRNGNYVIDAEEEKRRKQRILDLQSKLFGDDD